jgi:hypothetical protein
MDVYKLGKIDWDSINELSQLTGSTNPIDKIASTTKAAFTRAYNKGRHLMPYNAGDTSKKARRGAGGAGAGGDDDIDGVDGLCVFVLLYLE